MTRFLSPTFIALTILMAVSPLTAQEPKILDVVKIWDQAKHSAFTDLLRWRDQWYCVFREADGHIKGDGKIRVLQSPDGKKWIPVALVEEEGIDLRDPHLSVTPDDRLMLVMGGSVYKGTQTLMGRQPRVAFSKDARQWSAPQRVLKEGEWLWRVTWQGAKCYGISYNPSARKTPEALKAAQSKEAVSNDPADWKLQLVQSDDGVNFKLVTHLGVGVRHGLQWSNRFWYGCGWNCLFSQRDRASLF